MKEQQKNASSSHVVKKTREDVRLILHFNLVVADMIHNHRGLLVTNDLHAIADELLRIVLKQEQLHRAYSLAELK